MGTFEFRHGGDPSTRPTAFASPRAGGSVGAVPRPSHRATVAALLAVTSLLLGATPAIADAHSTRIAGSAPTATPRQSAAPFAVQGSVEQVAVTGTTPGTPAELHDAKGHVVTKGTTDAQGALLFRDVAPGDGYTVTAAGATSPPVTVTSTTATPPRSLYTSQQLSEGFGYLKTRDGTLLSVKVTLPGPADQGPYPTVVEYSGYDPSNPRKRAPASRIASLLGFATVGVNMRGTGCSGGSWDYFEPLQSLDGYDAIEAVAAQPWVKGGKVGMVGISYPGITQLFVAASRPPHLAAITPLSVIDDTAATLSPGGIFNNGFALQWAQDRQADAQPAGQQWAADRIAAGDTTCAANQALRLQSPDVLARSRQLEFASARRDSLAPATFVHKIDVPVFIAGAWQDQETGSHFANMLRDFSKKIPLKVVLVNGLHADSLGPAVLSQWAEFLQFYVAKQVPSIPPGTRALADVLLAAVFGEGAKLDTDHFVDAPSYVAALKQYEAEPPVRVLFEMGGVTGGSPEPSFDASFTQWPPKSTATTYWFGPGGTLTGRAPNSAGADTYRYDPAAIPPTSSAEQQDDSLSGINPKYSWLPLPEGDALGYVTSPLAKDSVFGGTGSVDLWLSTTVPDVDVEVTISEVRPDGQETYVQSGWLRASRRKTDAAASSVLLPVQTYRKPDVAKLSRGKAVQMRVPLYPFAHVFRAGSRIRIVVQPPGGNRPAWAFDALRYDTAPKVTVDRSAAHPSKVVLPLLSGVDVTTPLPACGTLRGQPCRPYVAPANAGS
jgi:predicted acyl esterase